MKNLATHKYIKLFLIGSLTLFLLTGFCILWISAYIVKVKQAEYEYTERLKGEIGKPTQIINKYEYTK